MKAKLNMLASRYWIIVGRVLWMLLAVNGIVSFIMTLMVTWQLLRNPSPRLIAGLGAHGLSLISYGIFFIGSIAVLFFAYFIVALLIFYRRPNDGFALFTAIFLVSYGAATAYPGFVEFVHFYQNPPLWYAVPSLISTLFSWTLLVAFLILYPDGRFVPSWSLVLAVVAFFLTAAWSLFPYAFADSTSPLGIFGAMTAVVVTGASLYVQYWRFRHHYSQVQQQQAKWFVFALAIFLLSTFLYFIFSAQAGSALTPKGSVLSDLVTMITGTLSSVFIPISIGIAILSYRLWDIDIIIRKTLQYALLTGLLALVYFGTVVLLQNIFESLTGQQSPVVIVISTLGIAALFNPLRHRVQEFIDRRFFRKKYDAEQALARFATVARDEVELDILTAKLVNAIDETLQPEEINLWLKQ
jgi:hypothetical protein